MQQCDITFVKGEFRGSRGMDWEKKPSDVIYMQPFFFKFYLLLCKYGHFLFLNKIIFLAIFSCYIPLMGTQHVWNSSQTKAICSKQA